MFTASISATSTYESGERGHPCFHTSRQRKARGKMSINNDSTLNLRIKKINPLYKGILKTHSTEGCMHKAPVYTIECFLLIQGQNCKLHTCPTGEGTTSRIIATFSPINPRGIPQVWSFATIKWITFNKRPATTMAANVQSTFSRVIDRIHKRRPRNYSFVLVLTILTSLSLKQKFF